MGSNRGVKFNSKRKNKILRKISGDMADKPMYNMMPDQN